MCSPTCGLERPLRLIRLILSLDHRRTSHWLDWQSLAAAAAVVAAAVVLCYNVLWETLCAAPLKFRYCEKARKIWKKPSHLLMKFTLWRLNKVEDFLWPSENIWTLYATAQIYYVLSIPQTQSIKKKKNRFFFMPSFPPFLFSLLFCGRNMYVEKL